MIFKTFASQNSPHLWPRLRQAAVVVFVTCGLSSMVAAQTSPQVTQTPGDVTSTRQGTVLDRFLGLPGRDRRPPQIAFVLPGTHPVTASEAPVAAGPSLNFQGMPGLIDTPVARPLADGEFLLSLSSFGGITRAALTFQVTPRLTGAFRYNRYEDINLPPDFVDYYDRAFDLQYQILDETAGRPSVAIGLRDFVGTGIDAAEYVVASKTFALARGGNLRVSGGVGWGRLGSYGDFGVPFSEDRPVFDPASTGGQVASDQWFRGPAALFGGVEWQPDDRWRVKLEYSSDAYELEAEQQGLFARDIPINLGVEYQINDRFRIGGYALYGTELGVQLVSAVNPRRSERPFLLPAPGPVPRRPSRAAQPEAWSTSWHSVQDAETQVAPVVQQTLTALGLEDITLVALDFPSPNTAAAQIENNAVLQPALAVGRTARVLAATVPASVEVFEITLLDGAMGLSTVSLRRSDLERLDATPDRSEALASLTSVSAAPATRPKPVPNVYPRTAFSFGPYAQISVFDSSNPLRLNAGLQAKGKIEFAPGFEVAGTLRSSLTENVSDAAQQPSAIQPVRTDADRYAAEAADITIEKLTTSYVGKLSPDLYGRVTVGYLEKMYGGISTEVLWKPINSRLALGTELNYVKQRDFDQLTGFQDYDTFTGHVSAYYDFGNGLHGQVDVGQYLAGDFGATVSLDREFDNGFSVGAFFTRTDVSFEDFGEGSFDKGIRVSIPLQWSRGAPQTGSNDVTIRPIQRDGGAKLSVDGRLYDRVRPAHTDGIFADWSRVWR